MMFKVLCLAGFLIYSNLVLFAQDSTLTRLERSRLTGEHYDRGISHFNKGQYPEAIFQFDKTTTLDPFHYLAYYFKGLSYEETGDWNTALQNYSLSLAAKDDFTEALFKRALVLFKLAKYDLAIKDLEQLLILPPGETQSVYFKGLTYGKADNQPGFKEVISMNKKEADIYNYIGLCYYELNQYNMAAEYFSKALDLSPDEDNIHVNAGLNYMSAGSLDSARIEFEKSLMINPNNDVAAFNLSILQPDSGNDQITQLNALIQKNPDFPMAYAQRAYQYYLANKYEDAISDYDMAIQLDSDNPEYYLERGMVYSMIQELDKAITDYIQALKFDQGNFQIWYNLANAYFLSGDYISSIESYTHAIEIYPDMPELYYNRSIAYYNLKDMTKACKDMQMANAHGMKKANDFIQKYCQ